MTHEEAVSPRCLAAARARRAARAWVDSYGPPGRRYPAICIQCHATHWQGRWRWDEPLPDLAPVVCPACERIRDGVAAHVLELVGGLSPQWTEVKGILGRVERSELAERPMERVMKIETQEDRVVVSTTGMHIARRIVAALLRRYRKCVRVRFADTVTRLDWVDQREAGR